MLPIGTHVPTHWASTRHHDLRMPGNVYYLYTGCPQRLLDTASCNSNNFSQYEDFIRMKSLGAQWRHLTLSRPGEHFMPPHLNHSISSKRLGVWSYCFVTFLSMYFTFRKVQFHQPKSPHVCCHGNHTTFRLNFENYNIHCFSSIST